MNTEYRKLMLTELRLAPYRKGEAVLTDDLLTKAVTLNENLKSVGYTLTPAGLCAIAVSPSLDTFWAEFLPLIDEVEAAPMYPGFPEQVMEIGEAEFRFHQMLHYLSTYGIEAVTGEKVSRGWLPESSNLSERTGKQETILDAQVVELIPEEEQYLTPLRRILSKRERMTLPERDLVRTAAACVPPEELASLQVPFKENLNCLYGILFDGEDREAAFAALRALCMHTGDVLRCIDILLVQNRHYHFRTSEKRFLVKLLESYPAADFRANLILSGKSAERNLLLLQFLDYSMYSRSEAHMDAVNALRDGKLRSWESRAKALLASGDEGTLDFIAERPGMLVRMSAWLLRLGYSAEEISARLSAKAASLSAQTLVTSLNFFGGTGAGERADAKTLFGIFETALRARLACIETPLRGKRVRLAMDDFDLARSALRCNDRSAEGGYISSGLAYRIPDGIDRLRFFVYWNDPNRVDIDLHAGFTDTAGLPHTVGWNADFRDCGVIFSGDITHSDAAEYIDIDLTADIDTVSANIDLYSGACFFSDVETCCVGMLAVPENAGRDSELYAPANCFFRHDLRQNCEMMHYGYIDVPNRCLIFDGDPAVSSWYSCSEKRCGRFSLARYLDLLLEAQGAVLCSSEEEPDLVLVMGKASGEKELSLIDSNFFLN